MQSHKMVSMANQIATYFRTQPGTDQAEQVASHINDFWEPRMRAKLAAHATAGGEGLSPLAMDALVYVRVATE